MSIFLFYPKDETKDVIVSLSDKPRLSGNPSITTKTLSKEDLITKTKDMDDATKPEMVHYSEPELTLRKGWEQIEAELSTDDGVKAQSWFYVWQAAVRTLSTYFTTPGSRASKLNSAVATI